MIHQSTKTLVDSLAHNTHNKWIIRGQNRFRQLGTKTRSGKASNNHVSSRSITWTQVCTSRQRNSQSRNPKTNSTSSIQSAGNQTPRTKPSTSPSGKSRVRPLPSLISKMLCRKNLSVRRLSQPNQSHCSKSVPENRNSTNESPSCAKRRSIGSLAIWSTTTSLPDLLRPTSGPTMTLHSQTGLPSLNSKMGRTSSSTVVSRAGTYHQPSKVGENQFDLYMRVDTNTNGHRQWFYFSIRNRQATTIKLNIFRFKKQYSLFQRGMRPYTRSVKEGTGWKAGGNKTMYKIEKNKQDPKQHNTYYLTFYYKFEHAEDEVYFSAGLPYTYSFLNFRVSSLEQSMLKGLQSDPKQGRGRPSKLPKATIRVETLGKSLCGLDLPLITIESDCSQPKNYLVIMARAHPGETSSSWVMDGLIEQVTSSPKLLAWITERNISLKLLPMVNPDGVFLGNYRTGIIGDDFNRKFMSGKKEIFPEVSVIKKLVKECKRCGNLFMVLDLHGHSILKNSFIYGPAENLFSSNPLRNLPVALWHSSKYFRLSSCKFEFKKDLRETARFYFQIKESVLTYTCQTSLGLYHSGGATMQMLERDYQSLGASIVQSMASLMTANRISQFEPGEPAQPSVREIPTKRPHHRPNRAQMPEIKEQPATRQKIKEYKHQKTDKRFTFFNNRNNNKNRAQLHHKEAPKNKQQQLASHPRISYQDSKNRTKHSYTRCNMHQNSEKANWKTIDTHNSIIARTKQFKIDHRISTNLSSPDQIVRQKFDANTTHAQQSDEGRVLRHAQAAQTHSYKQLENEKLEMQIRVNKKSEVIRVGSKYPHRKAECRIRVTQNRMNSSGEAEPDTFARSVTEDVGQLNRQISEMQADHEDIRASESHKSRVEEEDKQLLQQNFSQNYESINDSDTPSDDLQEKQKNCLIECLRNNHRSVTKTNEMSLSSSTSLEPQPNRRKNINRFKEILFKSVCSHEKNAQPIRPSKRNPSNFKEVTYQSANKLSEDQELVSHMIQKKQLNERENRKAQRQPYFLVQLKRVS